MVSPDRPCPFCHKDTVHDGYSRRSHETDVVSVPRLPQSVVPPKRLFLLPMSRVRQSQSIYGRERGHQAAMHFVWERVALSHGGRFRTMAGSTRLGQALPPGYGVIVKKYEQVEAASPEPPDTVLPLARQSMRQVPNQLLDPVGNPRFEWISLIDQSVSVVAGTGVRTSSSDVLANTRPGPAEGDKTASGDWIVIAHNPTTRSGSTPPAEGGRSPAQADALSAIRPLPGRYLRRCGTRRSSSTAASASGFPGRKQVVPVPSSAQKSERTCAGSMGSPRAALRML